MIDPEEWYNVPPCILKSVELLASHSESIGMKMKYLDRSLNEQIQHISDKLKKEEKGTIFKFEDLHNKVEGVAKKNAERFSQMAKDVDRKMTKFMDSQRLLDK